MKRMLINATQEEELRMAMVDGQRLFDLNIELPASERKKANIYKGQITRIEPSLEAAFVSYGADRHGFLPLKEISPEYFTKDPGQGSKINIRDVLKEGQDIVVQIDKEERGNKGAALTTFVSLAGRFIVLKPNKTRSGGVSRRIVGEDRDLARDAMKEVDIPKGMSVILRTAGIDRNAEELTWDIENLLSVWEAIKKVVVERPSPFLIYRESNSVIRALRDYLTTDIGEILIDDEPTYTEAREFVEQVMPHNLRKLKLYSDAVPLFTRYQIETQIESAFAHSVTLPSGGSLVIDHTEALVSIDINSARATKGSDIEATALNTNLEAADEIARQLRLRDLGGLIVIDYIDMGPQKAQREVENRLRDAVRQDRARVQIGKISRFGLLEMSRQRLRPSLGESSYLVCPRCSGIGNIRSVESLALAILRIIGEEARKERTAKVIAQLPVEVATYLLNEKRDWVQGLEARHDTQVILVANPALETPHYQIRRVRDDQVDLPENVGISYTLMDPEEEPEITQQIQDKKLAEPAAVTTVVATTPAPLRKEPEVAPQPGLLSRIVSFFSSDDKDAASKQPASAKSSSGASGNRRGGQRGRSRSDSQRTQGKKSPQRGRPKSGKKRGKKAANGAANNEQGEQQKDQQASRGQPQAKKANAEDGRPAGNKRRSRGGRRRRKNNDTAETPEKAVADTETSADATETDTQSGSATQKKPRRSRRKASNGKEATDKTSATVDAPTDRHGEKPANEVTAAKSPSPARPDGGEKQPAAAQTPPALPKEDSPRPSATSTAKADKPLNYEDTQPELPLMDTARGNTQRSRPAAKSESVTQEPSRPTPPAVAPTPKIQTPEAAPKPATPEDQSTGSRLLPWAAENSREPESADKD